MPRKHLASLLILGTFAVLALGSTESSDSSSSSGSAARSSSPSSRTSGYGPPPSTPTRTKEERIEAIRARRVGDCTPPLKWVRNRLEKNPEWSDDIIATTTCNRIQIGMTQQQAVAGWGRPNDINRTTTRYGTHEQWVYGEYGERGYLYFEDGILTSFQN